MTTELFTISEIFLFVIISSFSCGFAIGYKCCQWDKKNELN